MKSKGDSEQGGEKVREKKRRVYVGFIDLRRLIIESRGRLYASTENVSLLSVRVLLF